ncbi:hypothetical protein H6F90_26255 [Trichocoleus sp. FACHB-591]|uniref:hypothetical protein n=1 Tax=Trichocoleus sp. FACHB-591 TaxID=2692872 RepID=UPI0016859BE2|nr:hypothetical protein [Trichocoleus sp. FACHB-591]MBD2098578.1 hypothetical protein [Trichocoleus sp. FACHB-591]
MDEVIQKVAALGLPGVVLVIVMATTGLTGAAAITTALAILGGPAGMLGGIAVLGLTGLITESLAKTGLENLLTAIYCDRRRQEPQGKLLAELDSLIILDGDVKNRLRLTITEGCGCEAVTDAPLSEVTQQAIAILNTVVGITPAHHRDFSSATSIARLRDGATVRTWKNLVGVDHVFLANYNDQMVYGGFVGWIHSEGLHQAIAQIKQELT